MISQLIFGLTVLLLAACAVADVHKRIIPHFLIIGLAIAAVATSGLNGGWAALGWRESLIVLAVGFLLYLLKWMGAGDVKMLAAVSLWFPGKLLPLAFWVSLCGGALAAGYAVKRWKTGRPIDLPYALAIAAGSLLCFIVV